VCGTIQLCWKINAFQKPAGKTRVPNAPDRNIEVYDCEGTTSVVCQSYWLQIQRSGFDSRHYLMFLEIVVLERSPLSLMSTIEELLERKSNGFGL
jgi:hypothetical protein